jgi:hypothetical protein
VFALTQWRLAHVVDVGHPSDLADDNAQWRRVPGQP